MKIPLRQQLIKMALTTAPIMALMLITPIFILTGFHEINFFAIWGIVTIAISVAWTINLCIVFYIKNNWAMNWQRIIIVSSIMFLISFTVFHIFVRTQLPFDSYKIDIIRIVNILAINSIIYVLIDLTLTKENKNKIALENINLKLSNLEAEHKLLKEQINPHFLFNALSTAKALIKSKPELAEEYIIRLSDFLRASINNHKKTTSLKDELNLCLEFISLNQIRFGEALQFKCNINIDPEQYFVPYFSLLSLIENAIKHNTLTIETPLLISISNSDDFLEVKNNRQTKFVFDSSKTGLKNLSDRYKLLTGNEIYIEENESYFLVKIKLLKR